MEILTAAEKTQPSSDVRAEIEFESGRALYGQQKFQEAAARFAKLSAGPWSQPALLNASLAWLEAGDATKAQAAARELAAHGDAEATADFALEQASDGGEKRGEKRARGIIAGVRATFPHTSARGGSVTGFGRTGFPRHASAT